MTKFPKPADCLPLFRFGFDLQPEVWEYFLMTDKTKILVNERVQCGFPGITKFHCVAIRGCCFDDESGMQLLSFFKPNQKHFLTVCFQERDQTVFTHRVQIHQTWLWLQQIWMEHRMKLTIEIFSVRFVLEKAIGTVPYLYLKRI